jgi:cytochrome b
MNTKRQRHIPLGMIIVWAILIATSVGVGFADGWKARDLWSLSMIIGSGCIMARFLISKASTKND